MSTIRTNTDNSTNNMYWLTEFSQTETEKPIINDQPAFPTAFDEFWMWGFTVWYYQTGLQKAILKPNRKPTMSQLVTLKKIKKSFCLFVKLGIWWTSLNRTLNEIAEKKNVAAAVLRPGEQ